MGQQLVLSEGHLLNYSRLCALTASPQTLIGRRCRFLSALPSPESRCAEWRCRIAIGILRVIHLSGPSQGCFGQKMSARHRGISGLAGAIDSARPPAAVLVLGAGWGQQVFHLWVAPSPLLYRNCSQGSAPLPQASLSDRLPHRIAMGCLHVISQLLVSRSRPRTRCTHLSIPSAWPRVDQWWVDGQTITRMNGQRLIAEGMAEWRKKCAGGYLISWMNNRSCSQNHVSSSFSTAG